ncbi:MAG: PEP-CTERM sorting domain-containing protein [Kiritimatiellae bacterium]|nr:PEP-CTERM sorting domain-containing protein [Kiritimatiellia bacterium]
MRRSLVLAALSTPIPMLAHAWVAYNDLRWTTGQATAVDPDIDGQFTVRVAPNAAGAPAAYVNGFMIEAIPEPSTVALFGMGSLILLLRRRQGP